MSIADMAALSHAREQVPTRYRSGGTGFTAEDLVWTDREAQLG
jgi:hypothetical protein